MKLAIDEILLVTSQIRADQARIYKQTGLLSDSISHERLQTLSSPLYQPKPGFGITTGETECKQQCEAQKNKDYRPQESSNIFICVKGHAQTYQDIYCVSACKCACHKRNRFRSPRSVDALLGVLFFGYSVLPFCAKPKCTASECKGNGSFKIKVEYLFPLWFLLNVSARIMISSTGDPALCLTVIRARTGGSDMWRYIKSNDLGSLQAMYGSGRGSPNDIFESGRTALYVSTTSLRCTLSSNSEHERQP